MSFVLADWPRPSLAIVGSEDRFPVRRVFCVGKNYADHAREMGSDPEREPPFFFSKPADAVVPGGGAVPYPPATSNLHHEIELVLALGQGGQDIAVDAALGMVWGHAVGLDLTRRDLQAAAKAKGQPWDMAKGFDLSAPVGAVTPAARVGSLAEARLSLRVNGQERQGGRVGDMIWSIPEIIACLSRLVRLQPGDLIFTGTPAGVGPLVPGDSLEATIGALAPLSVRIID